jgi:DNA-binding transcriptional LysR family regulator
VVLVSHVATGGWVTVLPGDLAEFLAAGKGLAIVPIRAETPEHGVGLVAPWQEPHTPVLQALLAEAGGLAV